ncbi:hypothetical protein BH10PSE19_BH10PSE19_20100 [soil metagenome]
MIKKTILLLIACSFQFPVNAANITTVSNDTQKVFYIRLVDSANKEGCKLNGFDAIPVLARSRIGHIQITPARCQVKNQMFAYHTEGMDIPCLFNDGSSYTILGTENNYHCVRRT